MPDREEMFVNVLRDLEKALYEGQLQMTLFPRCNLFIKQNSEFRKNAADRLRKILRRLHFHLEEQQNEDATNRVLAELFHPRRRLELKNASRTDADAADADGGKECRQIPFNTKNSF